MSTKSANFLSIADCCIQCEKEKIIGMGEDSFYSFLNSRAGIAAVFDGCGGSGSKKYRGFQEKTGAYMASRVVSGAVRDWFEEAAQQNFEEPNVLHALKKRIKDYLTICSSAGGESTMIKGRLSKEFPTTAAIAVVYPHGSGIRAVCIWAGDSRCYCLSQNGLVQLTEDDLGGIDAMTNLTADGVLTNVITASNDFELHVKQIDLKSPCFVFSATDGCFGYLSTPMEFENLLLESLIKSNSPIEWESRLSTVLQEISGDDFSMCGILVGYGSYSKLKQKNTLRYETLNEKYIIGLDNMSREEKETLWNSYREEYECFLDRKCVHISEDTFCNDYQDTNLTEEMNAESPKAPKKKHGLRAPDELN